MDRTLARGSPCSRKRASSSSRRAQAGNLDEAGRWDESVKVYDRALPMSRATMTPGDVNLSHGLINRGVALGHLRRFDEALRDYDEAIALLEKTGGSPVNLAIAVY